MLLICHTLARSCSSGKFLFSTQSQAQFINTTRSIDVDINIFQTCLLVCLIAMSFFLVGWDWVREPIHQTFGRSIKMRWVDLRCQWSMNFWHFSHQNARRLTRLVIRSPRLVIILYYYLWTAIRNSFQIVHIKSNTLIPTFVSHWFFLLRPWITIFKLKSVNDRIRKPAVTISSDVSGMYVIIIWPEQTLISRPSQKIMSAYWFRIWAFVPAFGFWRSKSQFPSLLMVQQWV